MFVSTFYLLLSFYCFYRKVSFVLILQWKYWKLYSFYLFFIWHKNMTRISIQSEKCLDLYKILLFYGFHFHLKPLIKWISILFLFLYPSILQALWKRNNLCCYLDVFLCVWWLTVLRSDFWFNKCINYSLYSFFYSNPLFCIECERNVRYNTSLQIFI